jgi:hypothetical protein
MIHQKRGVVVKSDAGAGTQTATVASAAAWVSKTCAARLGVAPGWA